MRAKAHLFTPTDGAARDAEVSAVRSHTKALTFELDRAHTKSLGRTPRHGAPIRGNRADAGIPRRRRSLARHSRDTALLRDEVISAG